MPLLGGLVAIFVANVAGDILHSLGVPVPGAVLGMILFALALGARAVRPETVRPASNLLTRNMSLLFIPAGVGVMAYGPLIATDWFAIVIAIVVGTVLVLLVAGPLEHALSGLLHRGTGR